MSRRPDDAHRPAGLRATLRRRRVRPDTTHSAHPTRPTHPASSRSRLAGRLATAGADAACVALVTPTASSSRPTAALLAVGLVAPAAVAAPIAAREMSIPGARDPLATALTLQTVALGLASVVLSLELGRILCTAAVAVAAVAAWSGARAHDVRVTTRRGAGITRTGRTRSAVRRTVGIAGAVGLHHLLGGDALVHLATCSAASAVLVVATVGRGSTSVVRCAGHAHDARSVGA